MVALEESDSMTGLNKEKTGEQVFKTAATAKVSVLDKSLFKAKYIDYLSRDTQLQVHNGS